MGMSTDPRQNWTLNKCTVCIGREEREGFLDGRQGTRVSPEEGKPCVKLYRNHPRGERV